MFTLYISHNHVWNASGCSSPVINATSTPCWHGAVIINVLRLSAHFNIQSNEIMADVSVSCSFSQLFLPIRERERERDHRLVISRRMRQFIGTCIVSSPTMHCSTPVSLNKHSGASVLLPMSQVILFCLSHTGLSTERLHHSRLDPRKADRKGQWKGRVGRRDTVSSRLQWRTRGGNTTERSGQLHWQNRLYNQEEERTTA